MADANFIPFTNGHSNIRHHNINSNDHHHNENCPTLSMMNLNIESTKSITTNDELHPDIEPPDGGTRAWFVVISAFLCNSILFGVINTYGLIYLDIQERLTLTGDEEASSKAALVGSLTIGTTFLLSPVSGILTDKIGLRYTTFLGGVLAAGGMFLSSLCINNISALYLTYGIMFGLGAALAYTPTLAILGHYFKKYLGIVSGLVASGSSIFTAVLPPAINYVRSTCGLQVTFCILGCMNLFILISALIYKPTRLPLPPPKRKPGQSGVQALVRSLINVDNWKKRRYIIWSVSIPVALIGYFVPYVHMQKLVQITFPDRNENLPLMCIGIASGFGRLIFGYIADMKGVNRIMLQQVSFIILGILTMAIPLTPSYPLLLCITLGIGIVDGCFISLLGPVAFDICGPHGATQGIGFLLGLCSIPLTIGPPIAGMIYDQSKSYLSSFVLSGIPPLIGAAMMCLIRCVPNDSKAEGTEQEHAVLAAAKSAWNDDMEAKSSVNGLTASTIPTAITTTTSSLPTSINHCSLIITAAEEKSTTHDNNAEPIKATTVIFKK